MSMYQKSFEDGGATVEVTVEFHDEELGGSIRIITDPGDELSEDLDHGIDMTFDNLDHQGLRECAKFAGRIYELSLVDLFDEFVQRERAQHVIDKMSLDELFKFLNTHR